jgi:hypothetical protein
MNRPVHPQPAPPVGRTNPIHLPDRVQLPRFQYICRKISIFDENYGVIPTSPARETDFFGFAENFDMNLRQNIEAF